MKKSKKRELDFSQLPVQSKKYNAPSQIPLVPAWILMPLWFVSLALPNLVYSGILFADTLHILKWTVTGVPIAIAVIVAGLRLMFYGRDRIKLKIDLFSMIWASILIYCTLQPLWVKIFSPTGYALEMVCFLTVWAFYVVSLSSFPDWGLRPVLLLANVNAAINVMFAELQIRNMNNLHFLQGTIFADIIKYSSIILPTPGNYIGNTAQQNMFGLWVAVATLGAVYLFVYDAWKDDDSEHGVKIWLPSICIALSVVCIKFAVTEASVILGVLAGALVLLAFFLALALSTDKKKGTLARTCYSIFILLFVCINFWGLMNSTSRSATLALTGGLLLMLIISAWKFNRNYVIRFGAVFIVLATVFWASMYSPRSEAIVEKTAEIIQHAENIGNRRGIWATSYAMALEHPEGVGIGQYKWHYIEGQRYGFKLFPYDWYKWQYTHWAHNEFLQFFCEGGLIGGIMFLIMYMTWLIPAVKGLIKKERMSINRNAVWAVCLASLITFCALFTRPFHRIENMVWITLAFALSNREFLPAFSARPKLQSESKPEGFSRALRIIAAIVLFATSILALIGVMYAVLLGIGALDRFLSAPTAGGLAGLVEGYKASQARSGYYLALAAVLELAVLVIGVRILILEGKYFVSWVKGEVSSTRTNLDYKLVGALCVVASIVGCVYISSGIRGNYVLRQALSTQEPELQMEFLNEAKEHPIVYEETMRNVGYHYLQLGDQTDDYELISRGFDILWKHFNHEPHSEDISRILSYAQKYQQEEVLREIASYFKPGTYHLQRVPQRASDGHIVSALLLVNGPGEDDD